MVAAVTYQATAYAAETVRDMLQEEPGLSAAQVLERLEAGAEAARADLERWDHLRGR